MPRSGNLRCAVPSPQAVRGAPDAVVKSEHGRLVETIRLTGECGAWLSTPSRSSLVTNISRRPTSKRTKKMVGAWKQVLWNRSAFRFREGSERKPDVYARCAGVHPCGGPEDGYVRQLRTARKERRAQSVQGSEARRPSARGSRQIGGCGGRPVEPTAVRRDSVRSRGDHPRRAGRAGG